jgi:hypothetical protein
MLDTARPPLPFTAEAEPVVAALLCGRCMAEAAALLPAVFALCRSAQQIAAHLAFGLPEAPGARMALAAEMRRDHLVKLWLSWPAFLGLPARPLPADWAGGPALAAALFGPSGRLPDSAAGLAAFLASGHGLGPVLAALSTAFAGGRARVAVLPPVDAERAFTLGAVENSPALRHAAEPAMRAAETAQGRGPLWRALGRAFDLQAAIDHRLPAPRQPAPGQALVPAARGLYAVAATVRDGTVRNFLRVTPTDHMLARGGMLEGALAALPADRAGLAPLVLDILDPCRKVTLGGIHHA